jgi:hypothetical protein
MYNNNNINIFIYLYLREIVLYEFMIKGYNFQKNLNFLLSFGLNFISGYEYIDFLKYHIFIQTRLYRNLRLTFIFDSSFFLKKRYISSIKNKLIKYKTYFYNLGIFSYYELFEYLILNIFTLCFRYKVSLYGFLNLKLKNLSLYWNDMFSKECDLTDTIIYRESFFFKYEIPHLNFFIKIFFNNLNLNEILLYYTFIGIYFFFTQTRYFYKFYTRII